MAHLAVFLIGWPVHWAGDDGDPASAPEIDITARPGGGFTVTTEGQGEQIFNDGFGAAKALADALILRLIARDPKTLGLRAGAIETANGLAVFPGGKLSGRSTVSLQLAAAGYRLYGDDRLALSTAGNGAPCGMCLGLAPRIHMPMPPGIGARFEEFIKTYSDVQIGEDVTMKLWDAEAASFGETLPVVAVIELDRAETGPARLEPVGPVETLAVLKRHYCAPHLGDEAAHEVLDAVAGTAPGYRVHFSRSGEAAALIAEELGRK